METQKKKKENELPLYSKLFIVCDKDTTEDEIRAKFNTFGAIEYCKILKKSSEPKGVCFLKYYKTSAAAKAMEEMNGKSISKNVTPIKIQIAEQKNSKKKYSKEPEDTPPRSRLFVVCPKVIIFFSSHSR